MARPRGKSWASGLGEDIRGDTSAPAMSTMNDVSPIEADTSKWEKVRMLTIYVLSTYLSGGYLLFPGPPTFVPRETAQTASEAPQAPLVAPSFQRHMSEAHVAAAPYPVNCPSVRVCREPHAVQPNA